MSINDPQWGNSHRPEQNEPEQVPEVTGTAPVQPEPGQQAPAAQPQPASEAPTTPTVPADAEAEKPARSTSAPATPPATPPEGPPDLEDLWQQLVYNTRCKIARLFGQTIPPAPDLSTPPPSEPTDVVPMKLKAWETLSLKSWILGASLMIGTWFISGFYLVDTSQRGVVSRFGDIVSVSEPGWHWHWPYPIESVRPVNIALERSLERGAAPSDESQSPAGLLLTADGNLISVRYAVVYQVNDPVAYVSEAVSPAELLGLFAENTMRDAVAGQTLATMLTAGQASTAAVGQPMLQAARDRLQRAVDPLKLGIVVKELNIRDVALPPAVTQSIKEVARQEQTNAKALQDAQAMVTDQSVKARVVAATLLDQTAAYARALLDLLPSLRGMAATQDADAARTSLASQSSTWREQYPLVFLTQTELQAQVKAADRNHGTTAPGASSGAMNSTVNQNGNQTPAARPSAWRDREIMRSRDRIDRPGSGS